MTLLVPLCTGCAPSFLSTNTVSAEILVHESVLSETDHSSAPIRPIREPDGLNTEKVQLGKAMFHDVRLSEDNTISCASCHILDEGGDDGRPQSIGIRGQKGELNAPTILNAVNQLAQFWDGRADTLEEQVQGPVHNPAEMGSSWHDAVEKLRMDPDISAQFDALYPNGVTEANIVDTIVAYEQALVTPNSSFDRYLMGDENAISGDAKAGYRLFQELGCIACHQGVNVGGNLYQKLGIMNDYFGQFDELEQSDYGRFNVTGREEDRFRFKVPSLRNVAETAPYFHDGSVKSLSGAVQLMARFQLGRRVTSSQTREIVAFLESLTGEIDEGLL